MPPRLPNELSDVVISFVAKTETFSFAERLTLRNCALVCRDWLPASRHALLSDVTLTDSLAWDLFLRWIVNAEEGRPWLASIHRLTFADRWRDSFRDGKKVYAKPLSAWRGQYVIPVLAGHLPSLEFLSLSLNWERCPPHPSTFGMFSQFTSLHELQLCSCELPSFSTFRRILTSLPALENVTCDDVHWHSAPQPTIWALPSPSPKLRCFHLSLLCHACTLAVLAWLTHTPTRSTLVDFRLNPVWLPTQHDRLSIPGPALDYYVQILAPSIRQASFFRNRRTLDVRSRITLSGFVNLTSLTLDVDSSNWPGVVDMLEPLTARLDYLKLTLDEIGPDDNTQPELLRADGLELLDPLLSRENFKDLNLLLFEFWEYMDTLPPLRDSMLETIRRKLPALHSRATLKVDLEFVLFHRRPSHSSHTT